VTNLIPISELDFGLPDARGYQTEKQWERFKALYFEDRAQIEKLKTEPVYFIVGDKGTGKTALATYFINGMDDDVSGLSVFLEKADFTRFYSFSSQQEGFDSSDFGEMWKAVFSLLICYETTNNAIASGAALPEIVRAFFDNLQSLSFNSFDLTVFSAYKILFSQIKATSKAFLNADYIDDKQFSFYLRAMQNYFEKVYVEVPSNDRRSFVFVDGLDVRPAEGTGTHADHIANVTGLINAMHQMNHDGMLSKKSSICRVIVLVRPDIFEKLELQNVNNIWRTNTIQITYEVRFGYYRDSSLFRLSDYLIYTQQKFFPRSDYKVGECWDSYLPDKWVHLPSKEGRPEKTEDAFIGMLRNTFNRPRDIIYYLKYWKVIALSRNDAKSSYFDPKYTKEFKFRDYFNDYLLGEIRDSNYIVFVQFFHHLESRLPKYTRASTKRPGTFFDIRQPEFTSVDYIDAHREFRDYVESNGFGMPSSFEKPELFLQLLYELGLVFFKATGANTIIWKTYADAKASGDFRPQVKLNGEYRLHRGLAKAIYKDFM
jgi:hypothetical protein